MSELMDVLNAFAPPLKLAWVGWIAWGVGQYFWYRHERSMPTVRRVSAPAPAPAVKKPAAPKPVAVQAAEAPVVGRMITPTHVAAEPKAPAPTPVPAEPQAPEMPFAAAAESAAPVPAFDPSKAVIETFGGADDGVLDKFVRDFEMQEARPLRRRTRPAEPSSYGVEAPPAP